MFMNRLLVINQEQTDCSELVEYFKESGYSVICCAEYDEAVELVARGKSRLDLVIFDMKIPNREEYAVIDRLRALSDVGILLLAEDGRLDSQLYAYSKKVDDYIVKPVPLPLLEAHVEAILNRTAEKRTSLEKVGALSIDYEGRKVFLADRVLKVTAKEFDLLEYFIRHRGMILSRDKILDSVWGYDYIGGYRSVDTLVKKLRAKMTKKYPYIKTVYGVGYSFEV